jgi:hypothetical protein
MIDRLKLPLQFDSGLLNADLARIVTEEWVPHFNKAYYEGDWSVVPLRSVGGGARKIYTDPTRLEECADTPILARCRYFQEVLRRFECPLRSVRLLRLGAQARIREHTDLNLGYEDDEIRIHIPVATNPHVEFYLNGRRVRMDAGESWYLNFNLPHSLYNGGTTDRVHLVIDCGVNDWVRAFFDSLQLVP